MTKDMIFNTISLLVKEISQNPLLVLSETTAFSEIENWDSLNTVDLEIALESKLDIDFDAGEFQNYTTIEELVHSIATKLLH